MYLLPCLLLGEIIFGENMTERKNIGYAILYGMFGYHLFFLWYQWGEQHIISYEKIKKREVEASAFLCCILLYKKIATSISTC